MRRLSSLLYLLLHGIFFAVLFFVPFFWHGGEIDRVSLLWIWYPGLCFAAGIAAGLVARVPRTVRIAAGLLLLAVGVPAVLLTQLCSPEGLSLEVVVYISGVLLGILIRSGGRGL